MYHQSVTIINYHLSIVCYEVLWPVLSEVQTQVEEEARAVCDPDLAYSL